jgi:purine nucleosidase
MAAARAIPVILDTDPGVDDAVAILLALASKAEIDLLCLTAVAGNVGLERTAPNAQRICDLAERSDVEVLAGAGMPLDRPGHSAAHMHGTDGLGGIALPPARRQPQAGAVQRMIDLLRGRPGEITLCAVGPLTNLALAERQSPGVLTLAKDIVIMGGAAGPGNVTPHAEFNFYVDPLAAAEVFSSGATIAKFGLDLTRQIPATADRMARIAGIDTAAACACHQMMANYGKGSPLLHDVCVIAWLISPGLFAGKPADVTIDAGTSDSAGRSLVDFETAGGNAMVMEKADADGLFDLLCERLARLP